jgi:hypothetical protein
MIAGQMRPGLRKLLAVGIGLGVALGIGEAGLRLLGRFDPPNSPPVPRFPGFYRPDPELGYTLWPSTRITYNYPLGSSNQFVLASNSDGFRNARDFDTPDSRPRVWVLGDSMVLGDGVAAEARLSEVMERLEPGWRVDNLGMSGWGVDLMARAFERISTRVKPDVIVLGFYTDDFRRLIPFNAGQGYAFPKFELDGDRLVSVPFPTLPGWRRLRVVQAVEQTYWRLERDRLDLHAALLDRMNRGVRDQGGAFVVVFLPGRVDAEQDLSRREWLRDWCARERVPFLDLTRTIHGAGPGVPFIRGNDHWNELGHRLAGEAIRGFLRETVLRR